MTGVTMIGLGLMGSDWQEHSLVLGTVLRYGTDQLVK